MIVERFVAGHDYRVLVIDGQVAAAAQLRPACVTGDGTHTISQLVARVNADPRRGDGHARELTRITLDDEVMRHLDAAGLDGGSVPAAGQLVALRQNANLSTGGTSRDVTDLVHDDVAALCCGRPPRPGWTSAAWTCALPTSRRPWTPAGRAAEQAWRCSS